MKLFHTPCGGGGEEKKKKKNRLIRVTDRLQVAAQPADKALAERKVITFRRKEGKKKKPGAPREQIIKR